MATPGMSWQQHHHGKFTPSSAAAHLAGHTMDYSQDMHLKMSKKIAQLTKVRARWRWQASGGGGCSLGEATAATGLKAIKLGRSGLELEGTVVREWGCGTWHSLSARPAQNG